jgi:hypothetical protein
MRITATATIPGRIDLSALERLHEDNPIERESFHASISVGESIVVDDKYYTLINIQRALQLEWITISDYSGQSTFSQEISEPESKTDNYDLTKVEIWNRSDYPQDAFRKYNDNFEIIDANLGGVGSDEKVKYDVNDPVAGYLSDKILASSGISIVEGTGDEENILIVTNTDKGSDVDLSGLLPNSHLTDFTHSDIAHSNRTDLDLVSGENTGDSSGHENLLPDSHLIDFVHNDIAHSNRSDLDLVSGENTGDQVSSDFKLSDLNDVDKTGKSEGKILKVDVNGDHVYVNDESGTDEKIKYDINDITAGYLSDKIISGVGISLGEDVDRLEITNSDTGSSAVTSHESSYDHSLLHSTVTVTDSTEIDFTLTGQDITASLKDGSIDETKLDTSVNNSLDLADSALQSISGESHSSLGDLDYASAGHTGFQPAGDYLTEESDPVFTAHPAYSIDNDDITNLSNLSGTNTGDQDLSGYVPYTGATDDVDLGELDLSATNVNTDSLQFDTMAEVEVVEGQLAWNETDGTLDLGMSGGDVTMQIGQEMFTKVRNNTGVTLLNGTAVYINGSLGFRPTVAYAKSDSDSTSRVLGILTQDIAHNADGFATTMGYVRQIKTNYSGTGIWGTTWVEGDLLYVSKTDAGVLTNVEPEAPHNSDKVGSVAIVGAEGIGSILVNIERHQTIKSLSDIDGTPLTTDGQILTWHETEKVFDFDKNINDYLPTATASSTYVPYTGATGAVNLGANNLTVDTNTLFVDATNARVGIGTTTPSSLLHISSGSATTSINIGESGASRNVLEIIANPSVNTDEIMAIKRGSNFRGLKFSTDTLYFNTGYYSAAERMRITSTGNVGIGTTAPTEKLQISGNLFLTSDNNKILLGTDKDASIYYNGSNLVINPREVGSGTLNVLGGMAVDTNTLFVDATNARVGIGTTAPSAKTHILSSTEQLRLGYDSSKYSSFTTNDKGHLTLGGSAYAGVLILDNPTLGYNGLGYYQYRLTNNDATPYEFYQGAVSGVTSFIGFNNYHSNSKYKSPYSTSAGGIKYVAGRLDIYNDTGLTVNSEYTPTERISIPGSGNVGIGTTSPTEKLDVYGAIKLTSATGSAKISTVSTGSIYFQPANGLTYFNGAGQNNRFFAYDYRVDSLTYLSLSASNLSMHISGGKVIDFAKSANSYINNAYNFGLGTTTPSEKLDVDGTVKATGYKTGTETGITTTQTVVSDTRMNAGQLQKKTRLLTYTNGLLTAQGAESDWTDTTDV